MDILQILSSLNKVSLAAFIVVVGFLVYEIFQFKKEHTKTETPSIPQFDNAHTSGPLSATPIVKEAHSINPPKSIHIVIIGILVLMLVGTGGFMFFFRENASPQVVNTPSQPVTVRVFTTDWTELTPANRRNLVHGTPLIIGVEKVKDFTSDQARIRVNETSWNQSHITTQFNPTYGVYYVQYNPATAEAQLTIEAQLHSQTEGWLGE